jgi:MFS family permease
MTINLLKKDTVLTPEQLNEHDQITDRNILRKERYKFGFVNILYQGEEVGFMPIHTVIVRALGGSAIHLGICGAISTANSVSQWIGALLLKKYNSNRKAMIIGLWAGALCAFIVCGFILLGSILAWRTYSLWAYLIFAIILAGVSGVLWNIETNWIGDLVPKQIRGWFTSVKYIVGIFGLLCFSLFFGKLSDISPFLTTYSGLFSIIAISHIIAIFLVSTITDRVPKNANFISAASSHHERLNYGSAALWYYISFFILWASGRTALLAFATAYLIDYFHYSLTAIVLILAIQSVVSMILLLFLGKASDKYGNRIPLLLISGVVSSCMLLWVASAWWGIVPIIIYQFINGAAGSTHSMLSINYGLEIFPDKGRAGYFGFTRILLGTASMAAPIIAGRVIHNIEGFRYLLWGAEINHYHLFFTVCSLIALSSIIPLSIVGKRVVYESL